MAVTDLLEFMVTVQAPVPEQAPDQPVKVETASATAVRVTDRPSLKDTEQVLPQLMPAGELVTVPEPVPVFLTVRDGSFV